MNDLITLFVMCRSKYQIRWPT